MFDWLRRLFGISAGVTRVATDTSPRKMYSVLRHEAFHRHRADCGPDAPSSFSTPAFGLFMEIGYPGTTVTIAAFAGGATSLYMSNAFFVIGGEFHEDVMRANEKFIETANRLLEHFEPRESFPIPATWGITFYALTDTGILGADVAIVDLAKDRHALSPLFHAGHEVLEQLQLLAKAKETEEMLEVISAYDSAIAARPGDVKLYCARADAYAQLEEFDKAVADYGRAISLKPNDSELFVGRGYFYASMGDLTSSLADFDRAIALNPRDAMAFSNVVRPTRRQAMLSELSRITALLSRKSRATPTPTQTAHMLITRLVNTKRVSRIVTRHWTSGRTTQTRITIADTAAPRWVTLTAPAPIFKRRCNWPAARARRLKKLWVGSKPSPETQLSKVCTALLDPRVSK